MECDHWKLTPYNFRCTTFVTRHLMVHMNLHKLCWDGKNYTMTFFFVTLPSCMSRGNQHHIWMIADSGVLHAKGGRESGETRAPIGPGTYLVVVKHSSHPVTWSLSAQQCSPDEQFQPTAPCSSSPIGVLRGHIFHSWKVEQTLCGKRSSRLPAQGIHLSSLWKGFIPTPCKHFHFLCVFLICILHFCSKVEDSATLPGILCPSFCKI